MAVVTICSDFGAQENKICHCFHFFPIYLPWSDGTGCYDLFWMLSFKPALSLSSFTLIKRSFLFCGMLPNLVIRFPRVYLATFCCFFFFHLVTGIRYDPIRNCIFSLVYSFIRYLFNMNYMPGTIWWTAL